MPSSYFLRASVSAQQTLSEPSLNGPKVHASPLPRKNGSGPWFGFLGKLCFGFLEFCQLICTAGNQRASNFALPVHVV